MGHWHFWESNWRDGILTGLTFCTNHVMRETFIEGMGLPGFPEIISDLCTLICSFACSSWDLVGTLAHCQIQGMDFVSSHCVTDEKTLCVCVWDYSPHRSHLEKWWLGWGRRLAWSGYKDKGVLLEFNKGGWGGTVTFDIPLRTVMTNN